MWLLGLPVHTASSASPAEQGTQASFTSLLQLTAETSTNTCCIKRSKELGKERNLFDLFQLFPPTPSSSRSGGVPQRKKEKNFAGCHTLRMFSWAFNLPRVYTHARISSFGNHHLAYGFITSSASFLFLRNLWKLKRGSYQTPKLKSS